MNKELIKIKNENGRQLVSARELHEGLKIGKAFGAWMPTMISYGFDEGVDYTIYWSDSKSKNIVEYCGSPQRMSSLGYEKNYIITLDMAKVICRKQRRNINAGKILENLLSVDDKKVFYIDRNRKEADFGIMLEKITGFKFKKQYPIDRGRYRLDFYLPNSLIVEYDEKHHKNQVEEDIVRMTECQEWLKKNEFFEDWTCPVIRAKEGCEFDGIREVIEYLVANEHLDCWDNKCIRYPREYSI